MANGFADLPPGSPHNSTNDDDDNDDDDDDDDSTSVEDSASSHHDPDDDWLPDPDSPTATINIVALTDSVRALILQAPTTVTATTAAPHGPPVNANDIVPDPAAAPPGPPVLPFDDYYSTAIMSASHTYPHPELTKLDGTPTVDTLRLLTQELEANARSVDTTLGGGRHGHLALLHTDATYAALLNTQPWIVPEQPTIPTAADLLAEGGIPPTLLYRMYDDAKAIRSTVFATENALRQQIIAAVPPTYIIAHANLHGGIGNRSAKEILDYLRTTYGQTTTADRLTNEQRLNRPFNPNEPIETSSPSRRLQQ